MLSPPISTSSPSARLNFGSQWKREESAAMDLPVSRSLLREAAPSPASTASTSDLQRRLALEAGERDAVKLALARLRRAVAFYRQQMASAVQVAAPLIGSSPRRISSEGASAACLQRVQELTRQLDREARLAQDDSATGASFALADQLASVASPTRRYEFMRNSLDDAQRRCESLNSDMLCQAEANEELVEALNTVKDANKALLEQIRSQTEEIAKLTQQRISDETNLQEVSHKHREDGERIRRAAQQKTLAIREATDSQCTSMAKRFNDLRWKLRTQMSCLCRDLAEVQKDHRCLRSEGIKMLDEVNKHLRILFDEFRFRHKGFMDVAARQREAIEAAIGDQETQLLSERERRQAENLSWARQVCTIQADIDGCQARNTREVRNLPLQLQALERNLGKDRRAWAEERPKLERSLDQYSKEIAAKRAVLEQFHSQLVHTESAVNAADCHVLSHDQVVADLRRQIREADDALAAAVSGNEHLRGQMEEQRQRLHERNEVDLGDAKLALEQKTASVATRHEKVRGLLQQQVEDMELELHGLEDGLRNLSPELEALNAECASLSHEVASLGPEHRSVQAAQERAEQELAEARKKHAIDRLELQAGGELLQTQLAAIEKEIQRSNEQLSQARKESAGKEVEADTHASAGDLSVKDLEAQLTDLRRRLLEVLDSRQRIESEIADTKQCAFDEQANLRQRIEDSTTTCAQEIEALNMCLIMEQKASEQVKEQFTKEHDIGLSNLALMHEESRHRLHAAEREKAFAEDTRRRGISEGESMIDKQRERVEALERDLERSRHLLTESSSNLAFVTQEASREERERALELNLLREEVHMLDLAAEKVSREERSLDHQIGKEQVSSFRGVGSEANWVEETMSSPQRLVKSPSVGLNDRLESHIHRLQTHTNDVNRDVNAGALAAAALSPRGTSPATLFAPSSFAHPDGTATNTLCSPGNAVSSPMSARSARSPPLATIGTTATAPFTPPMRSSYSVDVLHAGATPHAHGGRFGSGGGLQSRSPIS